MDDAFFFSVFVYTASWLQNASSSSSTSPLSMSSAWRQIAYRTSPKVPVNWLCYKFLTFPLTFHVSIGQRLESFAILVELQQCTSHVNLQSSRSLRQHDTFQKLTFLGLSGIIEFPEAEEQGALETAERVGGPEKRSGWKNNWVSYHLLVCWAGRVEHF